MNPLPKYKVLKVEKHDCGLYRMYQNQITIDEPADNMFDILTQGKAIFVFPEGHELCLTFDSATISGNNEDAKTILIRDIYEKE